MWVMDTYGETVVSLLGQNSQWTSITNITKRLQFPGGSCDDHDPRGS